MNITGLLLLSRSPNQIPSQSNHTLQMEIHPALPGGCSKLCFPCWVAWYLQLNCCRARDRWQQYYWGREQINLCRCPHCKGTVEMGSVFPPVGILEALVIPGLSNGLLVLKVAAGASLFHLCLILLQHRHISLPTALLERPKKKKLAVLHTSSYSSMATWAKFWSEVSYLAPCRCKVQQFSVLSGW